MPLRDTLLATMTEAGFVRAEPDILQPADLFFELSGEEMRKRLFVTVDGNGQDLCLRPEFTIPIARTFLAQRNRPSEQRTCYLGKAFRHRDGESPEFYQAGLEILGAVPKAQADAEVLTLALRLFKACGLNQPYVVMGDTGLLAALFADLQIPLVWQRRILRHINNLPALIQTLDDSLKSHTREEGIDDEMMKNLANLSPVDARRFIIDHFQLEALPDGRGVDEVADRFLQKAVQASEVISPNHVAWLKKYFTLTCLMKNAHEKLAALAASLPQTMPSFSAALNVFDLRLQALQDMGVQTDAIHFDAAFGRRVDYYNGVVFEIHHRERVTGLHVVSGGRYDGLLKRLGATEEIPAVGCALWLERAGGEVSA